MIKVPSDLLILKIEGLLDAYVAELEKVDSEPLERRLAALIQAHIVDLGRFVDIWPAWDHKDLYKHYVLERSLPDVQALKLMKG